MLTHFWACNPGKPWWRKKELVTDICYWFFVPLFARVFRIGLLVVGAGFFFKIHDADELIAFYDNGHGPLAALPLWLQAILFLVLADFMMYWLHRMFHDGGFWKYHAIHHSSEDLDWISAARFHPVNLVLGTIGVDVVLLLAGISPNVDDLGRAVQYLPLGLRARQPELDARPVQICAGDAGVPPLAPHRRRQEGGNTNFAGTFPIWDILFGTWRMPENVLPDNYGIDDQEILPDRDRRPTGLSVQAVGSQTLGISGILPQLFAIISHIGGRLARSGAGSAAYRFCRQVNVPG